MKIFVVIMVKGHLEEKCRELTLSKIQPRDEIKLTYPSTISEQGLKRNGFIRMIGTAQ